MQGFIYEIDSLNKVSKLEVVFLSYGLTAVTIWTVTLMYLKENSYMGGIEKKIIIKKRIINRDSSKTSLKLLINIKLLTFLMYLIFS